MVCMQAILRLKCSTYSQAVHSAAYCTCGTRLANAYVTLCLMEQGFFNLSLSNTNVFCATLF